MIGLAEGRIVMDKPASALTIDYVRNIYQTHEQGMFFGLETETYEEEPFVTWSDYK